MTVTVPFGAPATDSFDQTPVRHHPYRWRLSRAGILNVWHYLDNTFDLSGGRLVLRGTNGSGKSRALEMLLPFLLDADRRTMGTGSAVRMEDLMRAGAGDQSNRLGYLWLELRRDVDDDATTGPGDGDGSAYLTLGALVRYAASTKEAKVWYFTTHRRVGEDLPLLGPDRSPLSRKQLTELVGEDHVTDAPERHRERVRQQVFGLTGELGKDRYIGLMKLLHTLRSPDVGNRIEEGKLPAILSDALPPLSEDALTEAGQQLDGLTETRNAQERLEGALGHVTTFLHEYRRYLTGVLTSSAHAVRGCADDLRQAERTATDLHAEAERLDGEKTATEHEVTVQRGRAEELAAALDGLRESEAFQHARELTERASKVESLGRAADTALDAASKLRIAEDNAVAGANDKAADLVDVAAALAEALGDARRHLAEIGLAEHPFPATFAAQRQQATAPVAVLRTARDRVPEEVTRPVPDVVTVPLDDPSGFRDATAQIADAASARQVQVSNRAEEAARLDTEAARVRVAVERAEDAEGEAESRAEAAEAARDRRDDEAISLAEAWRQWLSATDTVELLGRRDWTGSPPLSVVLADRSALCGEADDASIRLPELDRAADDAAEAVRDELTRELSGLDIDDDRDGAQVRALESERAGLREARDPDPPLPFWVTGSADTPMWRCVDFQDGVAPADRAGVEAALLASGLLTATVGADGRLVAEDGELLLTASAASSTPVRRSLAAVLSPDPTGPVPAETVAAILARIGLDDPTAGTWVGADGRWGNGPLRGRHTATAARHIGATARAAARAQRLTEIETELAHLADRAAERDGRRSALRERQALLRTHLRTAPRSENLREARIHAERSAHEARESQAKAATARRSADELSRAWAERDRQHRAACREFGLPIDQRSLENLARSADDARRSCRAVLDRLTALTTRMDQHSAAIRNYQVAASARDGAEQKAACELDEWNSESTKLEVMRRALGSEADQVQRDIVRHEHALKQTRGDLKAAEQRLITLVQESTAAAGAAIRADDRASQHRDALAAAVTTLRNQLDQPGVTRTALTRPLPAALFTESSLEAVTADVTGLLGVLRRSKCDENTLLRAAQVFEREVSDSYDVHATVASGVRLFDLVDSNGRRPLPHAAAELARQVDEGAQALTARERRVFTEFILGEVGEELRRRLAQAEGLIAAMNASLKSIRTSHGIGVRLAWKRAEEGVDTARLEKLVSTAAAVRGAAEDAELTELLSARVAAEATKDKTAGYAVHLRNALDYRGWHTVDVIITGPDPGQERHLRRRAKLSQGETRFVSYVTLFAAAEAYLSGLNDSGRALRLILLDDAFAKVDEPTIAELLGLLVRMDIDFAMTGHALWGTVPQVPALDVYEICREEGSPAITVHVHWDGHNRYLRTT